ncbi:MAG: Diphthamide biosynthesis protein 1, partial [Paramarteilia canceri]
KYDYDKMIKLRLDAIKQFKSAQFIGIIQGTLGRQGSPKIVQALSKKLQKYNKKYIVVMISEITNEKLKKMPFVDAWIQLACPRLSIDWGHQFCRPLISSFEAFYALNEAGSYNQTLEFSNENVRNYPMDFYSQQAPGPWSVKHGCHRTKDSTNL